MGETFDDAGIAPPRSAARRAAYLAVVLECDRPLAGGARYCLDGVDKVTIGRGESRGASRREERGIVTLDVRLPGRSLSGVHAHLRRAGGAWAIEDASSRNGTFVDGTRVERPRIVGEGHLIDVGHTLVAVFSALASDDTAPDFDSEQLAGDGHITLDPSFARDLEALALVAGSNVPVLVQGESGTGKEVLARYLHSASKRRGELVAVNCGALPDALVESQLFGHTKGAFSGAVRDEVGFFRAADGGTLFLDEIADMPKTSQAALLRALQEREVIPVGATRAIRADVRFVAATHEPLDALVARGAFRQDLLARIAGFSIVLPPLRARRCDLGVLIAAMLRKLAPDRVPAFTREAGLALARYAWPLNARELEQCLAVSLALSRSGVIDRAHLPAPLTDAASEASPVAAPPSGLSPRDERVREALIAALSTHGGNLAEVARVMGKARMQIHRWCKRFGIDPEAYRR